MNRIINNIDTFSFVYNKGMSSLFFPKDRIYSGKKIKRITFFGSVDCYCDMRAFPVLHKSFYSSLYVQLFDTDRNRIFKDLPCAELMNGVNLNIEVNRTLNYDLSCVEVRGDMSALTDGVNYSVMCAIEYDEQVVSVSEPKNCYTVTIPTTAGKTFYPFKDSDIVSLNEFVIKRIAVRGNSDFFLTLRDRGGHLINQAPGSMFVPQKYSEDLLLPNVRLDIDKCYLEMPYSANDNIILEFYY